MTRKVNRKINRKKELGPGGEKVSEKGSGNLCKLNMGLAGQSGGSRQLRRRNLGLAGQSGGGG